MPTAVTLPIALCSLLLLPVRLIRFRARLIDRRITVQFALITAIVLTHEPTLRDLIISLTGGSLDQGLIYQCGALGFMFATAASLLLAAAMLDRPYSPALVYGVAALSCAIALLCGGVVHGPRPEAIYEQEGWGQFGFWLALAPLSYWMVFFFVRVCTAEIGKRLQRREFALHIAVLATAYTVALILTLTLVAAAQRAVGRDNWLTDAQIAVDRDAIFLQALVFIGIGGMPAAAWLLELVGLDIWSRRRKRLQPLWSELTAACPEIVHRTAVPFGARQSRYLLHRTVIEIRDTALLLARYAAPPPPRLTATIAATARSERERDALDLAVRLSLACTAKSRGAAPTGAHSLLHTTGDSLADEAAELAAVAAQWSRARALVGDVMESRAT
ncbi:DUF6545 domain-containing protein [Nocardia brasiliensis]|uniref:DUF6545 domain-containing protein n=1 Tax=Nocardia brasiliensis TaxID=37326 RepID=UPI0024586C35|nr:DUF6545 domain-containing protein [Nocardia brasiliensis]